MIRNVSFRVWMKMPVIWLCHRRNPNNMIIGSSNEMIVVFEMSRRLSFQRDDFGKLATHP